MYIYVRYATDERGTPHINVRSGHAVRKCAPQMIYSLHSLCVSVCEYVAEKPAAWTVHKIIKRFWRNLIRFFLHRHIRIRLTWAWLNVLKHLCFSVFVGNTRKMVSDGIELMYFIPNDIRIKCVQLLLFGPQVIISLNNFTEIIHLIYHLLYGNYSMQFNYVLCLAL